ncbi:hypothetical protein Tco_1343841 [Tanacetum coccineum]
MKKLKKNMHAIQVGCQTCRGAHLDKEYPLNKEVKGIDEVKYGEFGISFPNNSRNDEATKRHAEQDELLKKFYQNTKTNREAQEKIIQGLETKVRTLTNKVEGQANGGKFKECKAICTEDGLPLYTLFYYSPEETEYFSANSGFFDNKMQETNKSRMVKALAALEATHEIKKYLTRKAKFEDFRMPIILGRPMLDTAYAKGSYEKIVYGITKVDKERERILKDHWKEKFRYEEDDIEEKLEDPEECGEDKSNTIIGAIHDKLNDDWFKEEIYTKVKVLGDEEMPRTRDNIASIRARLMEKMANEGNGQAKTFSQQGIGIRGLLDSLSCGDLGSHGNKQHSIGNEITRLRAMDDRLGDIDSNIYTLSNEVEDLTAVVFRMSKQYDQFYRQFNRMRLEQDSPRIFSTAPTAPSNPFSLFGTPAVRPSSSHNPKNDMDEE